VRTQRDARSAVEPPANPRPAPRFLASAARECRRGGSVVARGCSASSQRHLGKRNGGGGLEPTRKSQCRPQRVGGSCGCIRSSSTLGSQVRRRAFLSSLLLVAAGT